MNREEAVKLAGALKRDNLSAIVVDAPDGARIEFKGGAFGGHGLWLSVSSADRVLAHWDGYCSAQPVVTPPALVLTRYLVVVEGSFSDNDGWETRRSACVGWVEVEATSGASNRTISGLARKRKDMVQWEVDERVAYGMMLSVEVVND